MISNEELKNNSISKYTKDIGKEYYNEYDSKKVYNIYSILCAINNKHKTIEISILLYTNLSKIIQEITQEIIKVPNKTKENILNLIISNEEFKETIKNDFISSEYEILDDKILMILINLHFISLHYNYNFLFSLEDSFINSLIKKMNKILDNKNYIDNYSILSEYCSFFSLISKNINEKNNKIIIKNIIKIFNNYDIYTKHHNIYVLEKIILALRSYSLIPITMNIIKNEIKKILLKIVSIHKKIRNIIFEEESKRIRFYVLILMPMTFNEGKEITEDIKSNEDIIGLLKELNNEEKIKDIVKYINIKLKNNKN
jgi:hypothetical protein